MYSDRVEFNPCIVAFAGAPLSGKTTLGKELAERTNFEFFDIDEQSAAIEPQLGELTPSRPFLNSMKMAVKYAFNQSEAAKVLDAGRPVLLAATYSHGTYLYMLRTILGDTYRRMNNLSETPLRIFDLSVPAEDLLTRLAARAEQGNYSNVTTLQHAEELRRRFIPIKGDDVVQINTGLPLEVNVTQILTALQPFRKIL